MQESQTTVSRWSALLPRLAGYLPAEQFNQLRALPENLYQLTEDMLPHVSRTLLNTNRTLEPLRRVLIQYMPRYLIELDPTPGQPHGALIEGSFIFADVTGFTALTELLSRQGHAQGHELMNQIMNRLFTEILDPLIASGGDLLIFAGDAALVYFPKREDDEDAQQAIRAALRMERAIIPFAAFETEYGHCSLTMSAGVERGRVYAGVVGTPQRMELLISGPAIDGAMRAEVQAEPGRVALGEQIQAVSRHQFTLEGVQVVDDLGEALGDYEISLPTRKRGGSVMMGMEIPEILQTVEAGLERVEKLAPFLPEDMLAHLVNTDRRHRKLVSEFRPVAVQFIHIVGLETVATRQGPKVATELFQRYFVRAEEIVTQHEGVISQIDAYAGGFFLLNTYGTPRAHEGTTRYAVSAALQLAKLLDQVNRELGPKEPLQQRGGITYGLVFNGEIGAKYRRESVVAGPAVNRAARLMSKAEFGQVILDTQIWTDVQTAFVGEPLQSVQLKGIEGEVVIVNVHEIRRGTRLQPLERPLLGREVEQARLTEALEALLQRQSGGIWTIYGETGIGKTNLILDLAGQARHRQLAILAGRCQPHGKNIPLFVWVDLLTGWLDMDESTDPAKQRTHLAAELEALGMSEAEKVIVELLALAENEARPATRLTGQPPQKPDQTGSMMKRLTQKVKPASIPPRVQPEGSLNTLVGNRLVQAGQRSGKTLWRRLEERISGPRVIINLLQQLAQRQPLLLILEDLHWIDRESEALLEKLLAQMSADLPLMVVLTGRHPTTLETLALSPMALSGLSEAAIALVAQRALGGCTLDDSLTAWIGNQAHGNPLYAEELCRALRQANAVFLDREMGEVRWTKLAPALPLSLHELLLARLDELPHPQQAVLKRAAVMGVSFEAEGLFKLCQDRMDERQAEKALERAIQAGFVTEIQNDFYRFSHPLMQEAIYTTLSFSQRQEWHTQIGDWLLERSPEHCLELIAYHHLLGTDSQKAAEFTRLAGDKARAREVYAGALAYYEQVLGLENAPSREQMIAAESKADVLMLQNDYRMAEKAYIEAIELGSTHAPGKWAIVAGNLESLTQAEFASSLQAWAKGSQAWLLTTHDQYDAALSSAQAAVELAEDPAKATMESLRQSLRNGEALGPYEAWLQQFTQAVLSGPAY